MLIGYSRRAAHIASCPRSTRVRPFEKDATIYVANQLDSGEITVYRRELNGGRTLQLDGVRVVTHRFVDLRPYFDKRISTCNQVQCSVQISILYDTPSQNNMSQVSTRVSTVDTLFGDDGVAADRRQASTLRFWGTSCCDPRVTQEEEILFAGKSLRRWRVEWDYDVIAMTASHDRHRVVIDLDLLNNNSFVDWVVF
jgi:hypothetical protein